MLSACSVNENKAVSTVEKALQIDLPKGTVLTNSDTHSGFHGDGTTFFVIQFDNDALEDSLKNANWKTFPANETTQAILYGLKSDQTQLGPYLTDSDGNSLVPEVKNGYYWLCDRQTEEGKATGADLLHRSSFNFSIAVYDSDQNILYYGEVDT